MAAENISFLHVSNVKSLPSPMFEIELKATFIIVESNGGVDAETFTEVGRIISHVIHEFHLEDLINDGNGAVLDMLNSMRVPVQTSTVEEIAASAVRMAAAARDGGSRVLRMRVGIEAVIDDVPDFGNNDTDDDDDDNDDDDDEDEGTVRAEQATGKLVKLMVEVSGKDCAICLEELAMGKGSGLHALFAYFSWYLHCGLAEEEETLPVLSF